MRLSPGVLRAGHPCSGHQIEVRKEGVSSRALAVVHPRAPDSGVDEPFDQILVYPPCQILHRSSAP
jgi:hypothetical protein